MSNEIVRCEGWTRKGGAFSLGPVVWSQCENVATRLHCINQGDGEEIMPSCEECTVEAIDNGIKILESIQI